MKRIYLDHNASTPVHPEVRDAVQPTLNELFGNPSSVHTPGRDARKAVEDAREQVASLFGCQPLEVIFTASGSESDNLALKGVALRPGNAGKHIITSQVEHPAVRNSCGHLETLGFRVTRVPVNRHGVVEPEAVRAALTPDTILVSIMTANNETGCLMPIAEIGRIARAAGALMHTDAVQAVGKVPLDWQSLPVDLLTFSGHKINAVKGVGALLVRTGLELVPMVHGGHHERGRRAGTENVVGAVALGTACAIVARDWERESAMLRRLRDRFERALVERIDDIVVNGQLAARVPNTLNVSFRRVEGEALLLNLDLAGVACSSGSACTSGATEPSPVLLAMGLDPIDATGAIRFSLGLGNTAEEIDQAVEAVVAAVAKLRAISPLR